MNHTINRTLFGIRRNDDGSTKVVALERVNNLLKAKNKRLPGLYFSEMFDSILSVDELAIFLRSAHEFTISKVDYGSTVGELEHGQCG